LTPCSNDPLIELAATRIQVAKNPKLTVSESLRSKLPNNFERTSADLTPKWRRLRRLGMPDEKPGSTVPASLGDGQSPPTPLHLEFGNPGTHITGLCTRCGERALVRRRRPRQPACRIQ
jgi:hypothetical protein